MIRTSKTFVIICIILTLFSSVSAEESTDVSSPSVVVVASTSMCGGTVGGDIGQVVSEDAAVLKKTFPNAYILGTSRQNSGPASTENVKAVINRASRERGIVLVYSGHGWEKQARHRVNTAVCLEGDENRLANDVIKWISDAGFPWAVIVLSTCRSAFVDPSLSKIPMSVISASPLLVSTPDEGPSFLVDAIVKSYELAKTSRDFRWSDANCDGYLSDQELLGIARIQLKRDTRLKKDEQGNPIYAEPEITLRRQATSDIPIWKWRNNNSQCAKRLGEIRDIAKILPKTNPLRMAIDTQLDSKRSDLPKLDNDFFRIKNQPFACSEKGKRLPICDLVPRGIEPLPVFYSDPKKQVAAGSLLARFSTFAEIYEIVLEGEWLRIVRLRDDRHVFTGLIGEDWLAVKRNAIWATWADGDVLLRFSRKADITQLYSNMRDSWKNRAVSVCPSMEGQCFWLKTKR